MVEDNDTHSGAASSMALRESFSAVRRGGCQRATKRSERLWDDPEVEPYDVVLSDLRLPGADGVEVLRAARARDARTRACC